MKKFLFLILLSVTIDSSLSGQDVKITTSFDSTKIYIGDQIKYTITVDKPANLRLALPVLRDTLCKNIEILLGPKVDSTAIKDGRIKVVQKYLITSFDSGRYQVPPVFAEAKNRGGLKRYYSDYTQLEVMRVKIAPADTTAKIFDIIEPYKAPITFREVLPWLLIAALVVILSWAAIRFLRKFKKSGSIETPYIPPESAHVIAFRELEKLKNEELWQKGEIKRYYTVLTDILRQYLENRFRVFSLELTTSETLEALVKTGFKKNGSYDELKAVLTGADLVKFAKYVPAPAENESHFQNSWNFVNATREIEMAENSVKEKISMQEEVV